MPDYDAIKDVVFFIGKIESLNYQLQESEIQNIITRGQVDVCLKKKKRQKQKYILGNIKTLKGPMITILFSRLPKLNVELCLLSVILTHLLPSITQG